MRLRRLLLLALIFCFILRAQQTSLDAVKKEALDNPNAYRFLKQLDAIGPRLTGSPQEAQAGRWALQTMREIGLQHVHSESWLLERGWQRGYAQAQLISPFPLQLSIASYGWSGSTPSGGIEADVVRVDSDSTDRATTWKGKVLLFAPVPGAASRIPVFLTTALNAGAVAVIMRDHRPGMMLPHTGPISFPGRTSDLAVVDLAGEQGALFTRILDAGGSVRVKIDVQNRFMHGPVPSSNIVGEIAGSEKPEEILVVGAHLDSWDLGTGAIDDGFGVAAVLGAAKSIVSSGARPKRTIRIVLFTGEEQGLLGSRAYVRAHSGELQNITCALVLDWGNGLITKFPVAGHAEFSAALTELFARLEGFGTITPSNGYLTYTDAFAFTLAGIAGIAPYQDSPNYTAIGHSAADTLDKVDEGILARDSALLAMAGFWLANHPERIGSTWSQEKTAKALEEQRGTLQLLGLWPFGK